MAPLRVPAGVSAESARNTKKKKRSTLKDPASIERARQQGTAYPGAGTPRDVGISTPHTRKTGVPERGMPSAATGATLAAPIDPTSNPTVVGRGELSRTIRPDSIETLFANPQLLGQQFLENAGLDPMSGGGMYAVYDQLAQTLPSLFYLTQGGTTDPDMTNMGRFADYAEHVLNQMSTPGGGVLSSDVLANLFGDMTGAGGHPTGLGYILNDPGATATTQAQRLLGIASAGLSGLAPGIASGMMSYLQSLADQWVREGGHGELRGGTFADFLDSKGVDELFR
jgi:hypothetical protein